MGVGKTLWILKGLADSTAHSFAPHSIANHSTATVTSLPSLRRHVPAKYNSTHRNNTSFIGLAYKYAKSDQPQQQLTASGNKELNGAAAGTHN